MLQLLWNSGAVFAERCAAAGAGSGGAAWVTTLCDELQVRTGMYPPHCCALAASTVHQHSRPLIHT